MDLEKVKEANLIEDIVGAEYPLRGRGRYLRAEQHDSLIVDTHGQCYFWNSQGEQGDVITWVMHRRKCEFKAAVEWLCTQGGLPAPQWGSEDAQAASERRARYDALTIAARHFVRLLRQSQVALDYCHGRGWTDETIQAAGLGFADGDLQALRGEFSMHQVDPSTPAAQAAMKIGGGMLIYPHVEAGRVAYVSARAVAEKRHYNPPVDLVGERRVYCNWCYSPREDTVVLVEGQADAVTLGQWEIPTIALAGVSADQTLLKLLARHKVTYLALDQDNAGIRAAREIAEALGPLVRLVEWPEGVQDANEYLQSGATADDCVGRLAAAPTWVEVLAEEAGQATDSNRNDQLRRLFTQVARLDPFDLAATRRKLAEATRVGLREFGAMAKAMGANLEVQADENGEPPIRIEVVGGLIGDNLVELIYQPPDGALTTRVDRQPGKTLFAIRRGDGAVETVTHTDVDGVRYVPISPQNAVIREFVVQFPTGLGPLHTSRDLIQRVRGVIRRYCDVNPFYESLASYYCLFTWLYDAFNTVPYLRALGDTGTGKSRLIQVVGAMCYRPIFVSGAATVSPIFRILDRYRGTLVLDEADYDKSDETADIIKILNTGYQRTQGTVLRSGDRNTGFEPEVFVVYGPKLLATRKRFADSAVESRCLTQEMDTPTTRVDIPLDLPRSFWTEEVLPIRNALLRWRLEHWRPEIELNSDELDRSLEPRLNQVTIGLMTLVDDEDLRVELRHLMHEHNRDLIADRQSTLACRVLEAILFQYQDATDSGEVPDLTMKSLAKVTNDLINFENRGSIGDQNSVEHAVSPHKIGYIVRKQLNLKTRQNQEALNRRSEIDWTASEAKVAALRRRYGLDDETMVGILEVMYQIRAEEDEPEQGKLPLYVKE